MNKQGWRLTLNKQARCLLLVVIAVLCGRASSAQSGDGSTSRQFHRDVSLPGVLVLTFKTVYGTLRFDGSVERVDLEDEFEYRPQLVATFDPGARVNRTKTVNLVSYRLVATIPREQGPATILHEDRQPISINLTTNGESARLPALVFRLSKVLEAQAPHVGLSVTDGRLLWPIPVTLK
jgi:hypothetical protein